MVRVERRCASQGSNERSQFGRSCQRNAARLAVADSGDSGTHWFSVVTEVVRDGDESGAAHGGAERETDAWDAAREVCAALDGGSAHAGPLQRMVSLWLKPRSHALVGRCPRFAQGA